MTIERYEAAGKYWEIENTSKTAFTARWGKLGSTSVSSRDYKFADAAALVKARDKLVADKRKNGFALVGAAKPKAAKAAKAKPAAPKTNAKLEAMIAENPDDKGTWQVYADWLQEAGEPWGEVITMACAGKRAGKAQKAATDEILGGLDGSTITWKYGSIETLELCPEEDPPPDAKDPKELPMPRALARALAHPGGRLVRKLILGLPPTISSKINWSFDTIIPVIAKAGPLPLLSAIDMMRDAQHMDQESWRRVGDLGALWAAAPRLRELRMLGSNGSRGKSTLGDIDAPHLETLVYKSSGLNKSTSIDIGRAKLPSLRRLELYFGVADYGNDHDLKALAGILGGKGLPKLEYLGLENTDWKAGDETGFIEALAKSPLVRRLKTLDLSKGTLHVDATAALIKHAAKFRHLEVLDLDDNFIPYEQEDALEAAIPCVDIGSQREPDEYDDELYRYPSVGE